MLRLLRSPTALIFSAIAALVVPTMRAKRSQKICSPGSPTS